MYSTFPLDNRLQEPPSTVECCLKTAKFESLASCYIASDIDVNDARYMTLGISCDISDMIYDA